VGRCHGNLNDVLSKKDGDSGGISPGGELFSGRWAID